MQLLHENKTLPKMKDYNMSTSISIKDVASCNLDVKEKQSSNASLLLMNPVASGDNVTTGFNSAHKLKDEVPALVPCCEGKELQINEDLVRSGLSAISVKHDGVIQCLSMSRACERLVLAQPGLVKHRNSFRSLHRPDLKRVPYLRRMTPDELETLFRGYADDIPKMGQAQSKGNKGEVANLTLPPDETSQAKLTRKKINLDDTEAGAAAIHTVLETGAGSEDVPAGMRLHGARARLYTSVLAGAKAGDQLDGISTKEEYDTRVPEYIPEDELLLHEEIQIILPPRCDDVTANSSIASAETFT